MTYRIYKTDTRKSTKAFKSKETIDFFASSTYILDRLATKFMEKNTGGHVLEKSNKTFRYEFESGDTFELNIVSEE